MISEPTEKYYVNNGCPLCKGELVWDDERLLHDTGATAKRIASLLNPYGWIKNFSGMFRSIYYDSSSKWRVVNVYLYCKNCNNYFFVCPHCGEIDRYGTSSPNDNFVIKKRCNECHKTYIYSQIAGQNVDEDKAYYPLT